MIESALENSIIVISGSAATRKFLFLLELYGFSLRSKRQSKVFRADS